MGNKFLFCYIGIKLSMVGVGRALACESLGEIVAVESVSNNLTIKQVEAKVLSLNIRRNLSPTQRAISAYKQWKHNPKMDRKSFYTPWSTSNKMFQAAEDLDTLNSDWLKALFNDKKIKIGVPQKNSHGKMVQKSSNSVVSVRDWANVIYNESKQKITDNGDSLNTTFDDEIAALHKDPRNRYYSNMRGLYAEGTQTIKNKEVLIADVSLIRKLALSEAKLAFIISPKKNTPKVSK